MARVNLSGVLGIFALGSRFGLGLEALGYPRAFFLLALLQALAWAYRVLKTAQARARGP